MNYLAFCTLLVLLGISDAFLSYARTNVKENKAIFRHLGRWCCLNDAEFQKCDAWRIASNRTDTKSNVMLECIQGTDKFDCFKKIFNDQADMMSADAGEVYTAGKFYNLMPFSSEMYSSPSNEIYSDQYAVAVVKKGWRDRRGNQMTLDSLYGANSCHGGVGMSVGWNIPISTLLEKKMLGIIDCNNHVKAAANFFGKMCAPDALNVQFNPTGDNPTSACELCKGRIGEDYCTNQDPYAGTVGAMLCLTEGDGDVAFVKHTSVDELILTNSSYSSDQFELLCPNVVGSPYNTLSNNDEEFRPYPTHRAPISQYMQCNWGIVPGRAIITSSRKALIQRKSYREFLRTSAELFGRNSPNSNNNFNNNFDVNSNGNNNDNQNNQNNGFVNYDIFGTTTTPAPNDFFNFNDNSFQTTPAQFNPTTSTFPPSNFKLFNSMDYDGRDLLFLDQTAEFKDLDDRVTYVSFLPELYRNKILKLYECPLRIVRWCCISDFEKNKCRRMKNAFASRQIKPDLDCVSGNNAWHCMEMVQKRLADLVTLDPADAYRSHRYFGMRVIAAEDYGAYGPETAKPIQYAVAVVKRTDLSTNLWNLRTKRACGTAIGDMAGWHVPVDYLISIKELYVKSCNIPKVAGEYFGRSCIPGALDPDYDTTETNPRSLCLRCYSKGADYCSRSQVEYYYGDAGSFRCINEGEGDVAFVRHTAVTANTDGRNIAAWARPLRQTDFELLCKDGRRKSVEKYAECHMYKIPSRLIMIGGHRTALQQGYLWNMLNYAQQLFGSDTNPDFRLFQSPMEHPDLIFSDACLQLYKVNQELETYIGEDAIEMIIKTDPRMCNSAGNIRSNMFIVFLISVTLMLL